MRVFSVKIMLQWASLCYYLPYDLTWDECCDWRWHVPLVITKTLVLSKEGFRVLKEFYCTPNVHFLTSVLNIAAPHYADSTFAELPPCYICNRQIGIPLAISSSWGRVEGEAETRDNSPSPRAPSCADPDCALPSFSAHAESRHHLCLLVHATLVRVVLLKQFDS